MAHFVTVSYTHVLLDLDHTLLDTDTSLELAFAEAMSAVDADPTDRYPIFDEINRALWLQVEAHVLSPDQVHRARFERLNDDLGLGADPVRMADAFAAGMGAHGDLYDGAREMLGALAADRTLAMITNGLGPIQRARIERLGIGEHFRAITISAEVGVAKPSTAIFDLTFEALGEPDRSGALMVGDSLTSDIAGGHAAGIDTCWFNPSGRSAAGDNPAGAPSTGPDTPTHEISHLGELLTIVAGGPTSAGR